MTWARNGGVPQKRCSSGGVSAGWKRKYWQVPGKRLMLCWKTAFNLLAHAPLMGEVNLF